MEITPEGAIIIRPQKELEFPSPRELGSKIKGKVKEAAGAFFQGRQKVKEKAVVLSSVIAGIGEASAVQSWSEEQRKRFSDLEESITGLSSEKRGTIQRVFEEALPKKEGSNKLLARELASILKKPPQTESQWSKKQEDLAKGLNVMFQQRQGGSPPAHSGSEPSGSKTGEGGQGPQPDWNQIIGRTPEPKQEPPEERTKRELKRDTERGLEIRERRRTIRQTAVIVAGIIVVSALLERNSGFPISPVTQLLREQEAPGFQKPERRLYARPFTEMALSGTSDYTINEWFSAVYNTEKSRKNILDPHDYDGDGKLYIDELNKQLDSDGIAPGETAEALSQRGIYQNREFQGGLQAIEDIRVAWDKGEKMTRDQAENLRDYYTSQKPQFVWPEKIPEE